MMLSVLINNYNYARYLPDCIDSVLSQTGTVFEVIVVDDGSTDDSRAIIERYGDAIVPVLKANGGQASSFNAGFAAAKGDVLLLLDADDTFLPGKLATLARLYADDAIGWCFDRVTNDAAATIPPSVATTPFDRRAALRAGKFPTLSVPTSGLSFRRDVLAHILPMPLADDVVLSDNYLKFAASYLAPGIIVDTPLTFQRLHDANRYTNSDRARTLKPKIMVATGEHLARRFDGLGRMGRRLVAGGIADSRMGVSETLAEVGAVSRRTRDIGWTYSGLLLPVIRKRGINLLRAMVGR
jgi:glycosyltransferase involved in cell wall biosynthesis